MIFSRKQCLRYLVTNLDEWPDKWPNAVRIEGWNWYGYKKEEVIAVKESNGKRIDYDMFMKAKEASTFEGVDAHEVGGILSDTKMKISYADDELKKANEHIVNALKALEDIGV